MWDKGSAKTSIDIFTRTSYVFKICLLYIEIVWNKRKMVWQREIKTRDQRKRDLILHCRSNTKYICYTVWQEIAK